MGRRWNFLTLFNNHLIRREILIIIFIWNHQFKDNLSLSCVKLSSSSTYPSHKIKLISYASYSYVCYANLLHSQLSTLGCLLSLNFKFPYLPKLGFMGGWLVGGRLKCNPNSVQPELELGKTYCFVNTADIVRWQYKLDKGKT